MKPRLLAREAGTGKTVVFRELEDGRYAVETTMDVEPIFEANKIIASAQPSGWLHPQNHVAKIDMRVWQQLKQEGRVDEQKDFAKWLNDPDNRKWRTKGGRV